MNDVIQYQRIASGYVPGLSEHGTPASSAPPTLGNSFGQVAASSALLQNCTVVRPAAAGIYDIILNANGPAPAGLGGVLQGSPPLVTPASAVNVNQQARVRVTPRTILASGGAAPTTAAASGDITYAVWYGSSLGATPLYNTVSNDQVIRLVFTSAFGQSAGVSALVDCDFEFTVEQVIDPSQGV